MQGLRVGTSQILMIVQVDLHHCFYLNEELLRGGKTEKGVPFTGLLEKNKTKHYFAKVI